MIRRLLRDLLAMVLATIIVLIYALAVLLRGGWRRVDDEWERWR